MKLFCHKLFIFSILFFIFLLKNTFSQNYEYKTDFVNPLGIELRLSANFGELRTNHFHTGIDFKTQGNIGKNVYSVDKGYISRIKISPWGYGKTLYITHPNGLTSVYAHLDKYLGEIEKYIKSEQIKAQSFCIELFPDSNLLIVEKGEKVAESGNTGSSGGPHLHFELRDTKSEHIINPLLFHFDIKDNIKPKIYKCVIYPLSNKSYVNEQNKSKTYDIEQNKGNCSLVNTKPIKVNGEIGFGIKANDFLNNSKNKCGIYSIKLKIDNKLIYYYKMDEFSFDKKKCINSHLDYYMYKTRNRKIHRCFVAPNNTLNVYDTLINRGIYFFNDDSIHQIEILITDVYNNISTLNFNVQSSSKSIVFAKKEHKCNKILPYGIENTFETEDIKLSFDKYAFEDTLFFTFAKQEALRNSVVPVFKIHKNTDPILTDFKIAINISKIPDSLKTKALIVFLKNQKTKIPIESVKVNDNLLATVKNFGRYTVLVDNKKPYIKPINISENKDLSTQQTISFKVSDNLSGIKSYDGYIDGKWVLFEYDAKKNKITYTFENKLKERKKHKFELTVKDAVGNFKNYSSSLFW